MSPVITEQTVAGLNCAVTPAQGPPLLLLHGVVRRWQTFLPLWPMLGLRCQIFAPDHRGHGKSPRALAYHVRDYIDDAAAVLEAIGQPAYVYGHSLGGMLAFGLASRYPDRVRAVIAEDPPFTTMGEGIGETPFLRFFRDLHPLAGSNESLEAITAKLAAIEIPHGTQTKLLGDVRDAVSLRFTASALARLDPAVMEPIVAGAWLDGYRWPDLLKTATCPALVFQADIAAGGMLRNHDRELIEQYLPHSLHVPIQGCGHVMHWSQMASIAQHTAVFLETV